MCVMIEIQTVNGSNNLSSDHIERTYFASENKNDYLNAEYTTGLLDKSVTENRTITFHLLSERA